MFFDSYGANRGFRLIANSAVADNRCMNGDTTAERNCREER